MLGSYSVLCCDDGKSFHIPDDVGYDKVYSIGVYNEGPHVVHVQKINTYYTYLA
jgi:hypothetical protein